MKVKVRDWKALTKEQKERFIKAVASTRTFW